MFKSSNRNLLITFLALVAVMMYLLNRFTPLFCDDWHYAFVFGTPHTPIQSVGDILVSQWNHYFVFNGRFVPHFFVQLFDGILGKDAFNVINALLFALFLYVLAVVTSRDRKQYYKIRSVAFILVFLLMTGFKYVFLWMSGACNYLWMAVLLLFFHHLMERNDIPARYNVVLILFGFICGWTNEAIVLGLGGAYFLYYAFHRKQLTVTRTYLLVGLYVGMLFVVFSPASINRALVSSARQFSLVDRILNLNNLRLFFVLPAIILVKVALKRLDFKQWLKRESVFIMATLISLAFIIFTGFYYAHSRFGIELFSLVLILRVIDWPRVNACVITGANACVVAFSIYVITMCARCYGIAQQELSRVVAGDSQIATASLVAPSSYLNRYVLDYQGLGTNDGIDEVKYFGEDDWIPKYYGLNDKVVYFWPKAFLDDVQAHHDAYSEFRTLEGLPFYAMRLAAGHKNIGYAQINYQPSEYDTLPWPLNRLCSKIAGEVDHDIIMARVLPVNGEDYVIVQKMRPSQDDRITEILLKN